MVPSNWLSEDYLKRCFERKGGHPKGTISSFREEWGRKGKKEVIILFYISSYLDRNMGALKKSDSWAG